MFFKQRISRPADSLETGACPGHNQEKENRNPGEKAGSFYWRLLILFLIFLKIGAFTFGGGLAMLPVIKKEIVDKRKWVKTQEFVDIIAIAMTAPGAIVINTSAYVGHQTMGLPGSLAAVLGATLPSFLVILFIATFFLQYQSLPLVQALLSGIRPAIAALIAAAIFKIGKPLLINFKSLLFIGIFLAIAILLELHPISIIVLGGISGLVFFKDGETG